MLLQNTSVDQWNRIKNPESDSQNMSIDLKQKR